ncbi:MAG: DUF928 domain-containing protein [Jaaginema sp. PMC 1079.18]|nr:DUF928 domain-containing protein [Jaaginema sp. PMC 1080.18]MEC4849951.1 DUF928 domain-containing protein [Jaaginema sp. PMC 1079.18]MEC4866147.1 DUF928 domain-containing protein [Jaaginema sp. PMC 1078.18]
MKVQQQIVIASTLLGLIVSGDVLSAQTSDLNIIQFQKSSPQNNREQNNNSDRERDNNTKPPRGLDPLQCGALENLQAIVPEPNPVYTTSESPEVIFYFPEAVSKHLKGEFVVNTLDGKKRIYQTTFQLPPTESPGFFSISFPFHSDSNLAIPEDEPYRWYLKINCQGDSSNNTNSIAIDASIRRLSSTPENIINDSSTIWYDAVATLFHQLTETPNDPVLKQQWSNLLNEIESQHLADRPFLGYVTIVEE